MHFNHHGQLGHIHVHSELVDPLWPLHANISVQVKLFTIITARYKDAIYNYALILSTCNQPMPINIDLCIDCYWKSISINKPHKSLPSIINIYWLIDIDWYWLISIGYLEIVWSNYSAYADCSIVAFRIETTCNISQL